MYKALTYLHLPEIDARKQPGDKVTKKELEAAGQTDDDIKALLKDGALSEDMDAEIDPSHAPVTVSFASSEEAVPVIASDQAKGD